MGNLLEVKNLTVEYKSVNDKDNSIVTAVKNVTLSVKEVKYMLWQENRVAENRLWQRL